jgi:methylated-DNA-protein-cysteine methyltransferase-like protein
MKSFEKVYKLVSLIPKGKVTTYGAVSRMLSINPRTVGFALHANKDSINVPCHRVINSKGKISDGYAFGGPKEQKNMLLKEGVKFDKPEGAVDLKKYGFFLF